MVLHVCASHILPITEDLLLSLQDLHQFLHSLPDNIPHRPGLPATPGSSHRVYPPLGNVPPVSPHLRSGAAITTRHIQNRKTLFTVTHTGTIHRSRTHKELLHYTQNGSRPAYMIDRTPDTSVYRGQTGVYNKCPCVITAHARQESCQPPVWLLCVLCVYLRHCVKIHSLAGFHSPQNSAEVLCIHLWNGHIQINKLSIYFPF